MLRILDASAQTHEVQLLERNGRQLRLQSLLPIVAGTVTQIRLDGELVLGEVSTSILRSGHFEVNVEIRDVLRDSWHAHPDWSAMDSAESVAGSLAALNASLLLLEKASGADGD